MVILADSPATHRSHASASASQADGFLAKALPAGGIQADLDLVLGWATDRGFYVRGGAGIEVTQLDGQTAHDTIVTIGNK